MSKEKEQIIEKMKEKGCRMTRQRLELLDIILDNQCMNCKEIHWQVIKSGSPIGIATIYRMVNLLEEMGVLSRRIVYEPDLDKEKQ